jgi:hypothetical protein
MNRILSAVLLLSLALPLSAQQTTTAPTDPHGTPQTKPDATATTGGTTRGIPQSGSSAASTKKPAPKKKKKPAAATATDTHGTPQTGHATPQTDK